MSYNYKHFRTEYHNIKGILPGSPYPMHELVMAREEFARSWNNAIHRLPKAQFITGLHRKYPPNVRMRNCMDYPFASEDDELKNMPELPPASRIKYGEYGKSRPTEPSESASRTPASSSLPTVTTGNSGNAQPSFFICDHCSFEGDNSACRQHLAVSRHVTCSEYKLLDLAEYDDNNDVCEQMKVLITPRAIRLPVKKANLDVAGSTLIMCPTCYLICPDKITCAYHHRIEHTNYQDKYTMGTVLANRTLEVYTEPTCYLCRRWFQRQRDLVDHWLDSANGCVSPFLPLFSAEEARHSNGNSFYPLLVNVTCCTCLRHLERVIPTDPQLEDHYMDYGDSGLEPPKKRRKRQGWNALVISEPDPTIAFKTLSSFSRFCISHGNTHVRRLYSGDSACRLNVQFIYVHKCPPEVLPPLHVDSDAAVSRFCLQECQRLHRHVGTHYKSRKSLVRAVSTRLKELHNQHQIVSCEEVTDLTDS